MAVLIVAAVIFTAGWAVVSALSGGRLPFLVAGFIAGRRLGRRR